MQLLEFAGERLALSDDLVIAAENLPVLGALPAGAFDLVYMDPPFNTGRAQARARIASHVTKRARASASAAGATGRRCLQAQL